MDDSALLISGQKWLIKSITENATNEAYPHLSRETIEEMKEIYTKILPEVQLVIEAARKSRNNDVKVAECLNRLKSALFDIDDLLDEQEYDSFDRKMHEKRFMECECLPPHPLVDALHNLLDMLFILTPERMKVENQLKELKRIATEARGFSELFGINFPIKPTASETSQIHEPKPTSSFQNVVFGRDLEHNIIAKRLVGPADFSTKKYSIHAIVGTSGTGKTTLARYVFNDERVEKHFDSKIWISMSRKLDVAWHTKEMINYVSKEECQEPDILAILQQNLEKMLKDKKNILLVLDDVWGGESEEESWEQLLAPMISHSGKVVILLTSQSESLPQTLFTENTIVLSTLEKEDASSLFRYYAFSGAENMDPKIREEQESIADEIIDQLGGCPIVIKSAGLQLSGNQDPVFWRYVADGNNFMDPPLGSLRWCYEQFDEAVRACFLYCSIFPKGYKFRINDLVHMWMAESFVENEIQGESYFRELLSKYFFEVETNLFGSESYKMHDLVHDLAENLSRKVCFRIENEETVEIPSTVRYLSVGIGKLNNHKSNLVKLSGLRTLIFQSPLDLGSIETLVELLPMLTKLRVLSLWSYDITSLHELIGDWKHLRYLNIICTDVHELPKSICKFYNLRVLKLGYEDMHLPTELINLVKLRHVEAQEHIPNIGKLTWLQHLEIFQVRKESGYDLGQLGGLNELHGSLRIENLENVESKDEAVEACLFNKKDLNELHLVWSEEPRENSETDLEVIEELRPNPSVKRLKIQEYKNAKLPGWLNGFSDTKNIEHLHLCSCDAIKALSCNSGLQTCCNEVILEKLWNLRELSLPVSITELTIKSCPLLIFISKGEVNEISHWKSSTIKLIISNLSSIVERRPNMEESIKEILSNEWKAINGIFNEKEFDANFTVFKNALAAEFQSDNNLSHTYRNVLRAWWHCHLRKMNHIYHREAINRLELPNLRKLILVTCTITDKALSETLANLTALIYLRLEKILSITRLPSEEIMESLINMQEIVIKECWCLTSLGGLQALSSLRSLTVHLCPSLVDETNFPKSLSFIEVKTSNLWDNFLHGDLPALKEVKIIACFSFASLLIGHLSSLEKLELKSCHDVSTFDGLIPFFEHEDVDCNVRLPKVVSVSARKKQGYWDHLNIGTDSALIDLFSNKGLAASVFNDLRDLCVYNCEISSMGPSLKFLRSLENLTIRNCWGNSGLPDLPESIRAIRVEGCPELEDSCAPGGEDWPKIAHIPRVEFF